MSLKVAFGSIMAAMVIDMNETRLCSLEQLMAFLDEEGKVVPATDAIGRLREKKARRSSA